jgi:hypothetical protein
MLKFKKQFSLQIKMLLFAYFSVLNLGGGGFPKHEVF